MMQNVLELIRKNKNCVFSQIVSLYIYLLYMRIIYLSCKDINTQINNNYYSYLLNKKQWLFDNSFILIDIFAVPLFSIIILTSLYALYRKSRYFYVILLAPIFLGLGVMTMTPLYVLSN